MNIEVKNEVDGKSSLYIDGQLYMSYPKQVNADLARKLLERFGVEEYERMIAMNRNASIIETLSWTLAESP